MANALNPYGDGLVAERIVTRVRRRLTPEIRGS
jgi:UDP-N-acetylglucosamine 2-epimerase